MNDKDKPCIKFLEKFFAKSNKNTKEHLQRLKGRGSTEISSIDEMDNLEKLDSKGLVNIEDYDQETMSRRCTLTRKGQRIFKKAKFDRK